MEKIVKLLSKRSEYFWYFLFAFFVIFFHLLYLSNLLANKILLTNTLDFSWTLDMAQRFSHGFLVGRDFIFTYGPFYQLIFAAPKEILGIPSYASILIAEIILRIFCVLILMVIVNLLTKNKRERILLGLTFILLLGFPTIIDANLLFRTITPFVFTLLFVKFVFYKDKLNLKNVLVLSIPAILGTYIFELFLTCVIIILTLSIYKIFTNKTRGQDLFNLVTNLGIVIAFEILTSFIISGNLNYLKDSLSTVSDYQYIMNIPISPGPHLILFLIPFLLILVTLKIFRNKQLGNQKIIFLAFFITALIGVKSAVIRTDETHIIASILPSFLVISYFIFLLVKNKKLFFLILISIFIFFLPHINNISISNIGKLNILLNKEADFFSLYRFPSNYYLEKEDFNYLKKLIIENPNQVMVYPYENYLLNIYGQTFNTYALQFYDYSASFVEKKSVEELSKKPPKFIIYSIDNKGINSLDNIPNFSRNPILSKWIVNNYKVHRNMDKYLILTRDNKNPKRNAANCDLFSIDKNVFKEFAFEGSLKPSTFYLNDETYTRLPLTKQNREILFFKGFSDSDQMTRLINSNVSFQRGSQTNVHDWGILKKYSIPLITKTYSSFDIYCH